MDPIATTTDERGFSFATEDPDEFTDRISPVAPGFRVAAWGSRGFRADVEAWRLPASSLFTLRFGHGRVTHPGARPGVYLTIPLDAGFDTVEGGLIERFEPASAHQLGSDEPFDLRASTCPRFAVATFDGALLRRAGGGRTLQQLGLAHSRRVDLRSAAWSRFLRHLHFTFAELQREGHLGSERIAREVESSLAALLLEAAGTQAHAAAIGPRRRAAALRRAEDYIEAHLCSTLPIDQVAAHAGVSTRTLTRIFRAAHAKSPLRLIRDRRLEMARAALLAADARATTVTSVATTYGFTHLGRFAIAYRQRYGESPSVTLARRPPQVAT